MRRVYYSGHFECPEFFACTAICVYVPDALFKNYHMRFYFAFRTVTVFVDVYDIDGNFVFYRLLDDGYYGFGVILTVPS